MRKFAQEISDLLEQRKGFEYVALKIASDETSLEAQKASAQLASGLVDILKKEAEDKSPIGFADYINKLARELNCPYLSKEDNLKLAAAIAVDEALTVSMQTAPELEYTKLAESRLFGREHLVEILQGILC